MQYRPHVDGLRAVAVLCVLFYHAGMGFSGGFVGVDIFFVISGYLITHLILKDLQAGEFRPVDFWERRIRRIFPALAVVIVFALIAGWLLMLPIHFKELGQSAIAQALLVSNAYFSRTSGYFAQESEMKPLLHTWSLAVEEQFYLLFPLLLMKLHGSVRWRTVPVIVALGAVSLVLSIIGTYVLPSQTFYYLPMRAWELLLGALLAGAALQPSFSRWRMELLSWSGLAAIVYAVFFYDGTTRFPGLAALLPCGGAALLIWSNSSALTSVGRILATPVAVFIGLISYSLYLWHWPLLVYFKYSAVEPFTTTRKMQWLALTLLLAILSWRLVETPFRKRVVLSNRRHLFSAAVGFSVLFFGAGLAITLLKGVPARLSPKVLQYANSARKLSTRELQLRNVLQGEFLELGVSDRKEPVRFLVWGDSHAIAVLPVLQKLCNEYSVRGGAAVHSAMTPLVDYVSVRPKSYSDSPALNQAIAEAICKQRISDVLLVASWDGEADGTDRLLQGLAKTIAAIRPHVQRIWIMKAVPQPGRNVPVALNAAAWHGADTQTLGLPLLQHQENARRLDPSFEGLTGPGVTVLDPTACLLDETGAFCRFEYQGNCVYRDQGHLSADGAMLLRPLFEPIFQGIRQAGAPEGQTYSELVNQK